MPTPCSILWLRRALPVLAVAALAVLPLEARSVLDLADPRMPSLEGKTPQELFPWATFDPAIPTQEQVTGVRPGRRPLRHGELLAYLEALAAASPRAVLRDYATSWEGRRLVYLAVSDASTVQRLDTFRAEHARRTDPRLPGGGPEALGGAKAVAWMAYAIHGDELSSADAAAALAYWLVAGEDERAATLRRELVVLIDPCENPDGRDRFLAQTAAFAHRRPVPDPEDLSHATVWPWGRGNHYLFDLNRDWFTQIQPESARSGVIASWNPQLVVDSHEMGPHDTYLFPPPRHPFNPLLPPDARDWWRRFAADQARALDARGYGYYTREWNEEFFPGYGSSWASYLGAIGILYEMSSTEGTLVHQRRGVLRTYPQAVEHHVASSVANLETLARHREEILRSFVAGRRAAAAPSGPPVRAWVLTPERNADWARELAATLRSQGVEVLSNDEPVEAEGLHAIRTGQAQDRILPAGSFLVRTDQPAGRLVRVLLDPHVPMDAAFLREEREYLERGRGSRLYDTTAWSLPLLFGVEAFWTETLPAGAWHPWTPDGGGREDTPPPVFVRQARPEVFGYLADGSSDRAVFAAADLLARGVRVQVADRAFRIGGRLYPRGSLLVPREANPGDLRGVLEPVASRWEVAFTGTETARAEEGPDLGGSHFRPLVAPRIGVWTGYPVSPSDYGSVWHLLDVEADLRFTALDLGRFDSADLSRYSVLVFPPAMGGGHAYADALGEAGIERLRRWIEAGGTAVALGSAVEFFTRPDSGPSRARLRRDVLETYMPVVVGLPAEAAEAAGRPRAVGLRPTKEAGEPAGRPGKTKEPGRRRGRRAGSVPGPPGSPYDVAPLLGPGARPFTRGVPQPRALPLEPVDLASWVRPWLPAGMQEPDAEMLDRADARLRRFSARGVLVRVELDPEHYLAWGLPGEIAVWFGTSRALVAEPPVRVAARFETLERLHLGGLLWPEAAGRIARTAYATQESVGRGQVVLFAERPTYRGWPRESRRMFLNALVFGPGLGTRWPDPW